MRSRPFLSVIVPAYNEETRISSSLVAISNYLLSQPYSWELLVVDDGSTDTTAKIAQESIGDDNRIHLVKVPHGGKGWAVKQGMLKAQGEYRFLCDADLSMPVDQLSRFIPPSGPDADIVIGSREMMGSRRINEPLIRRFMSRIFNYLVRMMAVPGLRDTQCGFKCFKEHAAKKLTYLQKLHGFGFDPELLFLARKLNLSVHEVPIDWYYQPESKVRPVRDSIRMIRDLLFIRWRYFRGRYDKTTDLV